MLFTQVKVTMFKHNLPTHTNKLLSDDDSIDDVMDRLVDR